MDIFWNHTLLLLFLQTTLLDFSSFCTFLTITTLSAVPDMLLRLWDLVLESEFNAWTLVWLKCPMGFLVLQSDVVLKVGSKNPILETIKALLDRAAPLLVDEQCIKELFKLVKDAIEGLSDEEDDEYEWHESSGISPVGKKGLALLLVSYDNSLINCFMYHNEG